MQGLIFVQLNADDIMPTQDLCRTCGLRGTDRVEQEIE